MIKNYTSNSKQTFDKIQKVLITHRAKGIFFEYEETGKIKSLAFTLDIGGKVIGFKLPSRVDMVKKLFDNEGYRYDEEQPYKTAWANIRDWLDAQMALIDTGQVKIEEVFLPYAVNREGKIYFEVISTQGYLLPSGSCIWKN